MNCPKCEEQISVLAFTCPNCGAITVGPHSVPDHLKVVSASFSALERNFASLAAPLRNAFNAFADSRSPETKDSLNNIE